jgi:hypothetical protein
MEILCIKQVFFRNRDNLNYLEKCEKKIIDITGVESIISCYYNIEQLMKISYEGCNHVPDSIRPNDLKFDELSFNNRSALPIIKNDIH